MTTANPLTFNDRLTQGIERVMRLAEEVLIRRVAQDPYQMHIDNLLRESQDMVRLARSISLLSQKRAYAESLSLTRNLLERSFNFYVAVAGSKTISYAVVEDEAQIQRLNEMSGVSCAPHPCRSRREGICVTIIQESTEGGETLLPGLRYVRLESRAALAHSFPSGFRRRLWSYVQEDELRRDFEYWRRHYLDWSAHLDEAESQELIDQGQRALLQSHYGYLSAIAHSPRALTYELHGHNKEPGTQNIFTERLILLYLFSLLGFVFEPLTGRARTLGFWNNDFIEDVEACLVDLEIVRSELHFPFSSLHEFDIWQSENVRLATRSDSLGFHDLDLQYLTEDFLSRLVELHQPNTELSTGQHWTPRNFL